MPVTPQDVINSREDRKRKELTRLEALREPAEKVIDTVLLRGESIVHIEAMFENRPTYSPEDMDKVLYQIQDRYRDAGWTVIVEGSRQEGRLIFSVPQKWVAYNGAAKPCMPLVNPPPFTIGQPLTVAPGD